MQKQVIVAETETSTRSQHTLLLRYFKHSVCGAELQNNELKDAKTLKSHYSQSLVHIKASVSAALNSYVGNFTLADAFYVVFSGIIDVVGSDFNVCE